MDRRLAVVAAIAAAVNAGVFFDFSFVVMPGIRELPPEQGIAALQAFDRTAVTPPLMLLMYGTSLLCIAAIVRAATRWDRFASPWTIVAALAFLLATVVITGMGNVPVSAAVDALDPSGAGAAARWDELFAQWLSWNHARTAAAVLAAVGFATVPAGRGVRPGVTRRRGTGAAGSPLR